MFSHFYRKEHPWLKKLIVSAVLIQIISADRPMIISLAIAKMN
jgi:hypothetical protein